MPPSLLTSHETSWGLEQWTLAQHDSLVTGQEARTILQIHMVFGALFIQLFPNLVLL
jgi:hypothetical protein